MDFEVAGSGDTGEKRNAMSGLDRCGRNYDEEEAERASEGRGNGGHGEPSSGGPVGSDAVGGLIEDAAGGLIEDAVGGLTEDAAGGLIELHKSGEVKESGDEGEKR